MTDKDMALAASGTGLWADIPGFEGRYRVSELGQIWDRKAGKPRAHVAHTDGYPTVRFGDKRFYVHRLVCAAFHGEPEPGQEVAHLDGDPTNPSADNLAWVSRAENNQHKAIHGTAQSGENAPRAKLSAEQVAAVRASSEPGRALARRLGVNESAIRKIRKGERWTA